MSLLPVIFKPLKTSARGVVTAPGNATPLERELLAHTVAVWIVCTRRS